MREQAEKAMNSTKKSLSSATHKVQFLHGEIGRKNGVTETRHRVRGVEAGNCSGCRRYAMLASDPVGRGTEMLGGLRMLTCDALMRAMT